ncbi:MAG: gamma-glutamyl-gamma-aminobutyrate hydrolase family protein [Myxococcota bacterium]
MNRPQIGISLTLDNRGRWRKGRSYHYIDRSYADAIDRAGGNCLQLPIQAEPESLMARLDGLLLPGGDDFPADGELPDDVRLNLVSPEQLAFDEALFEAARSRGVPIFGICYGMQLMARARGGVLTAHLASQMPEAQCHQLSPEQRHAISIEATSRLASILGSRIEHVNSLHQQAVRSVGTMHRIVATSPDGLIEAIELEPEQASTWEIGVQWHPEKLANQSSDQLFRAFVDACRSPDTRD